MFANTIFAVDSHTAGEPTRIIVGGILDVPGKTMMEKKRYFQDNLDNVRTMLMLEPRGHKNMYGAVVTAPTSPEADFGVIFMDPQEYCDMCGHGSIGVVTVLIETGMVEWEEPVTPVVFDTPAGLINARARVRDGRVESVTFRNVPSFLYKSMKIRVEGVGEIPVDIAFGGNFYSMVSAKDLGIKVQPQNLRKLIDMAINILEATNTRIKLQHPEKSHIRGDLSCTIIYDDPSRSEADARNVVICRGGQVSREPCGTGTSARMATLYAKGKLKLRQEFVNESIIGTVYLGKLLSETKVGEYPAVVPEITGSAYITGIHTFVISPNDPLKEGFLLP